MNLPGNFCWGCPVQPRDASASGVSLGQPATLSGVVWATKSFCQAEPLCTAPLPLPGEAGLGEEGSDPPAALPAPLQQRYQGLSVPCSAGCCARCVEVPVRCQIQQSGRSAREGGQAGAITRHFSGARQSAGSSACSWCRVAMPQDAALCLWAVGWDALWHLPLCWASQKSGLLCHGDLSLGSLMLCGFAAWPAPQPALLRAVCRACIALLFCIHSKLPS